MSTLVVSGLGKRFDTTWALRDVSFQLASGVRAVVVGPSGSGKTTLLRLLAGLEVPDSGEIALEGKVVSRPGDSRPPHQRGMGMVFQSSALWPHMTVAQNVRFGLDGWPKDEARKRVTEVLDGVEIGALAERYPDQISGGEARRVALARALAPRPRWLLFDEPLTNLNRELRDRLLELIVDQVSASGAGMIYVTHAEDEVKSITRHPATVLQLDGGMLIGAPSAPATEGSKADITDQSPPGDS